MQRKNVKLALRAETLRQLTGREIALVRGGFITTAITDGNNGCQSEATGCHTGWTACGTC